MRRVLFVCLALLLLSAVIPAAAQNEITISLGVPTFFEDFYKENIIPAFEAANPGVKVHLVVLNSFGSPLNYSGDIESYLDDAADYFTQADVLPIDTSILREVSRAGYLLDLSPLANTDSTLNTNEFYPAAYQGFQWDGGLWGLPVTADIVGVFYDKQAFDEAGFSYPTDSWTMSDYAAAIRALTEFDDEGRPLELPVQSSDESRNIFFASLVGDVLDDSVIPNVPDYSSPDLAVLADEWTKLQEEGYFNTPESGTFVIGGDVEPNPLSIIESTFAGAGPNNTDRIAFAPLPGNQTAMTADGFGVSGGTRYPDAAYALAKFLTTSPEAATLGFGGGRPARRTVDTSQANLGGPGGGAGGGAGGGPAVRFGFGPGGNFSADVQAQIDAAFETARPARDFAFAHALQSTMQTIATTGAAPESALQEAEAQLLSDLQAAESRRSTPLVVDAPPAPVVLNAGEVAINFGVGSFVVPLPNLDRWQRLADEFAASDPQVGAVTVTGEQPIGASDYAADYDCFIQPNNPVQQGTGLDQIRSLDPLLQSDPSYNPNDLYPGVVAQVQRDGMTWGMPLAMTPQALDYETALFQAAGVPEPSNGWTVSDFETALRLLSDYLGETALKPDTFNTTYLSTLIAAYGGLPYDARTTPATLNYTGADNVAAIQQVLDLIVAGYIEYTPFTSQRGGGLAFAQQQASAISTVTVGQGGLNIGAVGGLVRVVVGGPGGGNQGDDPLAEATRSYAPYPTGSTMNGASYDVVAGFISANTSNTEACYRWLRTVAQHPELFGAMPVTRAQVADPALDAAVGADQAAFFRSFGALLDNPSTQIIDAIPPSFGLPTETYWLLRAFDRYVESEGELDLELELAEAQEFTETFRDCTGGVDIFSFGPGQGGAQGGGPQAIQRLAQTLIDCANSVDPSTQGVFLFG